MTSPASARGTVVAATIVSATMIGQQVAGKAARDAFFLSQFDVSVLPTLVVVSALTSIAVVRGVMGRPPGWLLPRGFAWSGVLLLAQWWLSASQPRLVAVALYLHMAIFGSILISGFWALVTERLDPHTARRRMGQIATGSSVGAVLGGLLAERVGALSSVTALFPVLGGLHLLCAGLVLPLRPKAETAAHDRSADEPGGVIDGLGVFARVPYLRHLAYLVFCGAVSAALIDFAFKAEVAKSLAQGEAMMRFFAVYYTGLGIASLIVQGTLSQRSLNRLGLGPTVASLPGSVVVGGVGMILAPGMIPAIVARGAEAVFRSSLFRSGYELFYSPVSPRDKRATKTVIDVLGERLGDVAGGAAATAFLVLVPTFARSVILGSAAALGVVALWMCRKLHRGYVEALEVSLRGREHQVATVLGRADEVLAAQGRGVGGAKSVLFTIEGGLGATLLSGEIVDLATSSPAAASERPDEGGGVGDVPLPDPVAARLARLRSHDAARVRRALRAGPLERELVPQAIQLLARDEVADEATRSLVALRGRIAGQLGDALVDPESEFSIRRRVAEVLGECGSARAAPPLLAGLRDRRFEVRRRCGRALVRLRSQGVELPLTEEGVYAAVRDEVEADRSLWGSPGQAEETDDTGFDELLKRRAHRRLEHVFTLLSLTLPRKPLKIAFRGIHTDDEHLRGTSLEYLESVLPADIRQLLWPLITASPTEWKQRGSSRTRQQIVADLMRSGAAIVLDREESSSEEW